MAADRTIIIAGAGIGGLTAALALAARGFQIILLEKSDQLEEVGAGLQLSPNASRVLIDLGLEPRLQSSAIVPDAVCMMSARSGREVARLPLGADATARAGAPYWVIHRADLQAALAAQVRATSAIELRLGWTFEQAIAEPGGVGVAACSGFSRQKLSGLALIGADGIWSATRNQLFPELQPRFSGLLAWRGTFDASRLPQDHAPHEVRLWMGADAHLVVYPISGGRRINIVAIVTDSWNRPGWSAPGDPLEIKAGFSRWPASARAMIDNVEGWRRWALFTMKDGGVWNKGSVALLGDASHGMLPFAAQGAGMAIEDAAVLAACLGDASDPAAVPLALHRYARLRGPRVSRVQQTARQNGHYYHMGGPMALARDLVMRGLGPKLLARQDWIYDWRCDS
jgi:salicylate hydroxylase